MYRCISWADNFKIQVQLRWHSGGQTEPEGAFTAPSKTLKDKETVTQRTQLWSPNAVNSVREKTNNPRFQSITQDTNNKNSGINLEEREICTILSYWLRHLVYTTTVDCANSGSKCNVQSLRSAHDPIAENGDEKMEANLKNSELVGCRISDTAISNKAVKTPMCYLLVPSGIREHMQGCQEVKVGVQVRAL